MLYNNLNPVITTLGPFEIRWYGLLFALGVIIVYFLLRRLVKKKGINLNENEILDFVIHCLIGVVVGARIFSIISDLSYYLQNPLDAFATWHGGLAFHGGLIGAVIAGYVFCRKKRIDFWEMADFAVIPVALALAIGRIGNFINGEFYGIKTGLPWGVYFKGVEGARHPVQIYEVFKNMLIFGILWKLKNKKLPKGTLFWTFILSYGILRFAVENLKDLPRYAGLTWGQWWSLPMILTGAVMIAVKYKIGKRTE